MAFWTYVKTSRLQDETDPTWINLNESLQKIFNVPRLPLSSVSDRYTVCGVCAGVYCACALLLVCV